MCVVGKHEDVSITVTLSFLQLYRETIQDLLAPATQQAFSNHDDNGNLFIHLSISFHINVYMHCYTGTLQVREDPSRGFYVDGLQEFIVRSYNEAETLVNLGMHVHTYMIILTFMHTCLHSLCRVGK